jgi:hypothetical protein
MKECLLGNLLTPLCFSRQLEIHSPDAKHTVVLRSKDSATAQAWFSAIHSNVSDLLTRVIAEVREQLGKTGIAGSREIRHLGWLAEKVRKRIPSIIFPLAPPALYHCHHVTP